MKRDLIKVLVVEDDMISQMTLAKMLEDMGYTNVEIVNNANSAFAYASNHTVHIVLMDIFIKGAIDGIETAKLIKDKYPDLAIIFLSASTDPKTKERINEVPHEGFLNKPYNYDDILQMMIENTSFIDE